MNKLLFLTILSLTILTTVATVNAVQIYDPYTQAYSPINSWNHNSPNTLARPVYYGEIGRPQGYGLIRQQTPYPRNTRQYCENNEFIGHTSAWRPGRFYSGMNSMYREPPMYRSQSNRCAPVQRLNLNTFSWNY